ncbi:allantoin racemase [Bacillus thermophilus]|uniref:Allantoin racemase n=1 Tax=Siminovitchia thermophila TaxID=1245522 RepID=A0ABS2R5V3_9BACI|nr:aspartate/glutamate racemase family protein [Siminovitchia thermophila]MBM7714989.1 allantoin racemase [Siminovitchia thermophila]ONK21005.1 hydantoin racemase [Bacillus sp. VT-16-64]
MKRILFLNPIHTNIFNQPYLEILKQYKNKETEIEVTSLEGVGPKHLEYTCYEAIAMPNIVKKVKEAENAGFDGMVIGCFYDTALRAAREVSQNMMITAPAESSLHIGATLGESISIIVGQRKWIPEMQENVSHYGYTNKVTSFKSVNLGVHEFQKDLTETKKRIMQASKEAIKKDGADVIILGCTAEFGMYGELQEELGIPVIDSGLAAFKYAELLTEMKGKMNWSHSKRIGYQSPLLEENFV